MDIINVLPDHILIEIFGFLSPRMIKCCSLICKRWDKIIGTSSVLMGRFQLNFCELEKQQPYSNRRDELLREAMKLKRKHQTAIVTDIEATLDVLLRHKLQSINLKKCKEIKLSTFVKAINSLPSLKVIDAKNTNFIDDMSGRGSLNQISINIEQLKCTMQIIHLFACCSVKKLKLLPHSWYNKPIDEDRKTVIIDFLKRQKNLEDLDLDKESFYPFLNLPALFELNFPNLKVLKIRSEDVVFVYYKAFIKFLDQHKNSLTSLEVCFCIEPHFGLDHIHKFALENIVNLKHIQMIYFDYNSDYMMDVMEEMNFNELPVTTKITKNLESLTINAPIVNEQLFDMLPNLKYLQLMCSEDIDCEQELLQCVSERCLKLEGLRLSAVYDDVYFPNLKELTVEICNGDNLAIFINRHSKTLERITVKQGFDYYLSRVIANEILNCPNLNYLDLKFRELYFATMRLFAEISLKTKPFTLKIRNLIPNETHIFKFPDDEAIWDRHDDDFSLLL